MVELDSAFHHKAARRFYKRSGFRNRGL